MNGPAYPSFGQILESYRLRLDYERYLFVSRYLFRPLSFPAVWVLVRLGVSSESVSWFSGLAALSGLVCLVWPGEPLLWPGIASLILFNYCDCLDGNIARVMRTWNPYGRFLDSMMSWADMFFWAAVGAAVWRMPSLRALPCARPELWLAAGTISSLLVSYAAYLEGLFDAVLRGHWDALQAKKGISPSPNPLAGRSGPEKIVRITLQNLRVRETQYVLLALSCLAGAADVSVLLFLALNLLVVASHLFVYCRRGRMVFDSGLGRGTP